MSDKSEASARPRILVVDDERVVLDLFNEILSGEDCETVTVKSAAKALALIGKTEFHVIISDFRMPGMSGEEFYLKAKEIKPGIEKRFIFTSGEMDPVRKRQFIKRTGAAVISKPFQLEEIKTAIKAFLEEQGF